MCNSNGLNKGKKASQYSVHHKKAHKKMLKMKRKKTSSCWRVNDSDLNAHGSHYILERNHILVEESAPLISGRISEFMRLYSVVTEHNSATSLRCTTSSFLVTDVNLWRRPKQSENLDDPVVVELCIRQGDSAEFHRFKRLLFKAIKEGIKFHKGLPDMDTRENPFSIRANVDHNRSLVLSELGNILKRTNTACELMEATNARDNIIEGLRLLDHLTSEQSIHRIFARNVSFMILTGTDPFGRKSKIRGMLLRHIRHRDDEGVYHYSLQIIGNAFGNVQNDMKFKDQDFDLWGSFIPSLVVDMENAQYRPHIAYNAAKFLRSWLKAKERHPFVGEVDIDDATKLRSVAVHKLYKYGREKHAAMEKEAMRLVMILEPSLVERI